MNNIHEIKKMKVYLINSIQKIKKEQRELLDIQKRNIKKDEMLTVKEVLQEFKISRSTFDRWRAKGLKVYQDKQGSAVRIKRVDVLKFIKN